MNVIKRWIARWAQHGSELLDQDRRGPLGPQLASDAPDDHHVDLNIQVTGAIGGKIIRFRHYDQKTGRSETRAYIITDEEPFDTSLGRIITMESMRL
jgi:hypothetical protein